MTTHKFIVGTCYACDAETAGVTTHNGAVKGACRRHMDPTMKTVHYCYVCDTPTRAGSVCVGVQTYAHAKCERQQVRS